MEESKAQVSAPGIAGTIILLATVALVTAKLAGWLTISWWIVFAPLMIWVGLAIVWIAIGALFLTAAALIALIVRRGRNKKRNTYAERMRNGY